MSRAIELIVTGYVKTRDRRALEGLLEHRRVNLTPLQAISGISASISLSTVKEEIQIIEAGLDEMRPPPDSLPDPDWT